MLLHQDMLLPRGWLCLWSSANSCKGKVSLPSQQELLHGLISLHSGSVSTCAAQGSCRDLDDVSPGLGTSPKSMEVAFCPLPVPSTPVWHLGRCTGVSLRAHACRSSSSTHNMHGAREGTWTWWGDTKKLHLPGKHWDLHP